MGFFGLPNLLVTSKGTDYLNTIFASMCSNFVIKDRPSYPNNPQANGLVESQNKNGGPICLSCSFYKKFMVIKFHFFVKVLRVKHFLHPFFVQDRNLTLLMMNLPHMVPLLSMTHITIIGYSTSFCFFSSFPLTVFHNLTQTSLLSFRIKSTSAKSKI